MLAVLPVVDNFVLFETLTPIDFVSPVIISDVKVSPLYIEVNRPYENVISRKGKKGDIFLNGMESIFLGVDVGFMTWTKCLRACFCQPAIDKRILSII